MQCNLQCNAPCNNTCLIVVDRCRDPNERIADALGAIGWPVVQAGVSTLLGIIVMLLVPSNVVRMFARWVVGF